MTTKPGRQRLPATDATRDLYHQPGHLIRRAHQISSGLFAEHLGNQVTPVQYAILAMVHEVPGIDQVGLAARIGLDTSTTALTAARLDSKGLLTRSVVATNRRQLKLTLTSEGEALLGSMVTAVRTMRIEMLAALDPDEQELFVRLLQKFVHVNNEQSRAPLRAPVADLERAPSVSPRETVPSRLPARRTRATKNG